MSIFDSVRVTGVTVREVVMHATQCVAIEASDQTYFYVVRRGPCWLEAAELEAPLCLESGDMITLVAGQPHRWRVAATPRDTIAGWCALSEPAGGDAAARLLVCSAPRSSNAFVSVYPSIVAIARSEREVFSRLHQLVRLLETEAAAERPGKDAVLKRTAELMVIELVRFALPRLTPGSRSWLGGLNDHHIGRAIGMMHEDVARDWSLQTMAAEVGLSRAVFVERFTRLTGEPPARYLRRIRMHRAATELESGARAIVEIAELVGYLSESAFNKAFSKEMGMPPARYRTTQRNVGLS